MSTGPQACRARRAAPPHLPARRRRRAAGTAATCGDPYRRPGGAPERAID